MPTVAEVFLRSVVTHGCEAIFLNPGTDTPPLQEAYARMRNAGEELPQLIVCPHEIVAATAAQGHYLASGRPQIAFVHVDVGTANAAGSLNDARASQIPVILCAGMSPSSIDTRIPGARTKFINWQQDVPDQASIVRNYVKWAQSVTHASTAATAVDRAWQISRSEPQGPVYLSFSRETLMEEAGDLVAKGPERAKPARLGGLDADVADDLVSQIVSAEFPLLITGFAGRSREHRDELVAFAEELALPITEYRGRFNAPLENRLHLGLNPERWVEEADLIVVIDHDVPFVPADRTLRAGARMIHLGPDPIKQSLVVWGFPADEVYPCNVIRGIRSLRAAARRHLEQNLSSERLSTRRSRIEALHDEMINALPQAQVENASSITPAIVGAVMSELCPEAMVFEEAVTSGNPFAYAFRPSADGEYLRNGGTFLGWGLGACLGAKLAQPDRLIASVLGDGSFMFGVPSAALWVSKAYHLPVLIVILNNGGYNSVRLATSEAYPDGIQVLEGYVGTELPELPDFSRLAMACDAHGLRVERPGDLRPALEEALSVVKAGKTAVVDVLIEASSKPL